MNSDPNQRLIRRTSIALMAVMMIAILALYISVGRNDKLLINSSSIPAGLRTEASANLVGYIGRAWGGDNFEFGDATALHYFFITGIDCPEPGQPFFEQSRRFLLKNYRHKILELTIDQYDDAKRESGHVIYVDPNGQRIDVGLQMIQNGMAWYDGTAFDGAEAYRDAFEKAKREKLGLWIQPNPVPPWDFYRLQKTSLRGGK